MTVPHHGQPCIDGAGDVWLVSRVGAMNGVGLVVGVRPLHADRWGPETTMRLADWRAAFALPTPPGGST